MAEEQMGFVSERNNTGVFDICRCSNYAFAIGDTFQRRAQADDV